ncbi:hypothetical protein ABOM_009023 [Aspergillus bombycis]|uniref:Short-chain dehydrogenase n=1 Tax=Aspergillus bombycis TaxID=109264 RepID=A0A1F7ZTN7_9EURO|nr:hypothetical protein ABOM_009023 [Aspergillus bombycis]OGM42812.1 hypothetical protein ABOM_009023 [Aspergillus bombycis]
MLQTEEQQDYAQFIQTQSPSTIAACLRRDQILCQEKHLPSPLAMHLPTHPCELLDAVSKHLIPDTTIPAPLRILQCQGIISGIKAPTQDFQSALRVLEYLQKHPSISQLSSSSPFTDVISSVKTQLAFEDGLRAVTHLHTAHKDSRANTQASYKARRRKRNCYMCHFEIRAGEAHDTYPSLCRPCGSFNLASSAISQPPNLRLRGKTALVTGGRINLAMKPPCGCCAVTLTDPVRSETKAIMREEQLEQEEAGGHHGLIADYGERYVPKLRGGAHSAWGGIEDRVRLQIAGSAESESVEDSGIVQKGLGPDGTGEDESRSSWVQRLDQIPYEDVISAQAVNAFVPLILCRELLPRMGATEKSSRPLGYIVNVSSREGILETRNRSASKAGHHVHTNMSKAALNMITETESESAWKRHVAMNTVDPGYMSAAPECQHADGCPIGFEDGAARVLWPIAIGEREHRVIRGRFMKHFGHHDAVISRGV